MKKSELTQLTQIIEILVAKEVRKQLPGIIAETFQNMMGRQVVAEARQTDPEPVQEDIEVEETTLKQSLREMFAGTPVMRTPAGPRTPRQLAKDPVLNQILNQTRPFTGQEKMAMGGGPGVMMAMAGMPMADSPMPSMAMTGVGEMMDESELPSFARNMPSMPGVNPDIPLAQPPALMESQASLPIAAMGEVSALDVARAGMVPGAAGAALTNFDRMRKILQQSKGPRH